MNKHRLFFTHLALLLATSVALAQPALRQQKQMRLPASPNYKITDVIVDPKTGSAVKVFSQVERMDIIKTGHYAGLRTPVMKDGVILPSGKVLTLPTNESVLHYKSNQLVSIIRDIDANTSVVRTYAVDNTTLSKPTSQHTIQSAEVEFAPINNGKNILLTDNIEGSGQVLEFYSANMQPLKKYIPLKNGYSHVAYDSDENRTVIAVLPQDSKAEGKLMTFDTQGILISSQPLPVHLSEYKDIETRISRVFLRDKYIVATGYKIVVVYDLTGKKLWEKEVSLPYAEKGIIYNAATDCMFDIDAHNRLVCFKMNTGEKLWEKDFSQLLNKKLSEYIYLGINTMQATGDGFALITSEFHSTENARTEHTIKNSILYILDSKGNIINKSPIAGTYQVLHLESSSQKKSLRIINDQTITDYNR